MPDKSYQVGVIPFTDNGKVVLVTTQDRQFWIFPKGKQERGVKDYKVAKLEAYEEAGLKGIVSSEGELFDVKSSKADKLLLFPMQVTTVLEDWPEKGERDRTVVSIDKADKMLQKDLRTILRYYCTSGLLQ